MLLSLFHPPCKVKKSLMHLDHSRGKKKGGGKKKQNSFFLFLFTNGLTMFICASNILTVTLWFEGLAALVLRIFKKILGVYDR